MVEKKSTLGSRLRVRNFRGVREASWAPERVCALVGPNSSCKSTLLEAFHFVHHAAERSPKEAILVTGGMQAFVNQDPVLERPGDDPALARVELTVEAPRLTWTLSFSATDDNLAQKYEERLRFDEDAHVDSLPPADVALPTFLATPVRQGPSGLLPPIALSSAAGELKHWLAGISLHRPWELQQFRKQPWSEPGLDDVALSADGANLFVVLQNWRDDRKHAWRFDWVVEHLRDIHARSVGYLELKKGVGVLGAQLYAPGSETPLPIKTASNGVLGTLLSLTAAASGTDGGLVLIDEPDNGLHPSAIRALIAALRGLHEERNIHVVLATHSPVILNAFTDCPDDVWVTESKAGADFPVRLTDLCDSEWLANFRLGNLYGTGFGKQDPLSGSAG